MNWNLQVEFKSIFFNTTPILLLGNYLSTYLVTLGLDRYRLIFHNMAHVKIIISEASWNLSE